MACAGSPAARASSWRSLSQAGVGGGGWVAWLEPVPWVLAESPLREGRVAAVGQVTPVAWE